MPSRKEKAFLLFDKGELSNVQISKKVKSHPSTISKWRREWKSMKKSEEHPVDEKKSGAAEESQEQEPGEEEPIAAEEPSEEKKPGEESPNILPAEIGEPVEIDIHKPVDTGRYFPNRRRKGKKLPSSQRRTRISKIDANAMLGDQLEPAKRETPHPQPPMRSRRPTREPQQPSRPGHNQIVIEGLNDEALDYINFLANYFKDTGEIETNSPSDVAIFALNQLLSLTRAAIKGTTCNSCGQPIY